MGQSLAIPRVIPEDWKRLDLIVNKIKMRLGTTASPTHVGLTLTGLTASTLIGANASKALESVTIGTGLDYTRPTLSLSHLGIESLTDPGADRILFWDDSATACKWLVPNTLISITGTNLNVDNDLHNYDWTNVDATDLKVGSVTQAWDVQLDDIAALAVTNGNFIVGNGTTWVVESGATARTSIGLGTGDSPQFTSIELGHATDTTITRASAGNLNIEGNLVYRASGTDVPITDGGTGQSTAQAAINALSAVSGATNEHVLTKDTATGNAIFKVAAGGTDEKVKIDVAATAGYLGAASNDGVLRTTTGLSYADGGNFVTLGLSHLGFESLTSPAPSDRIPFWDNSTSSFAWLSPSTGLAISGTSIGLAITALTLDAAPDGANDYVAISNGATHNKISLNGIFGQGLQTTASPTFAGFTSTGQVNIEKEGAGAYGYVITYRDASSSGGFVMQHARGTKAAPEILVDNDYIGFFYFQGYDGNSWENFAYFGAQANGTVEDGGTPGDLLFATTPASSTTATIRMKVLADGGVMFLNLKSGANQAAAGAATNEIYHDTDDNTIKIGV